VLAPAREQAGRGHGAVAMLADDRQRPGRRPRPFGERAELEVGRAGQVPGGELGVLADVEHPPAIDSVQTDQGDAGAGQASRVPGPYCVLAPQAVQRLRAAGFDARRLVDGMPEWRLAGLPVAAGGEADHS
jgi:hypothetical protein